MGWRNLSKTAENKQRERQTEKYTRCAWAGGTFLRCLRKVPQAHSQSVCVLQFLVEPKSFSRT
jgi:hypothetical protein